MSNLQHIPAGGFVVIVIIGILFVLSVILLFHVYLRYRVLAGKASGDDQNAKGFKAALLGSYIDGYKKYGEDVNIEYCYFDEVYDSCTTHQGGKNEKPCN